MEYRTKIIDKQVRNDKECVISSLFFIIYKNRLPTMEGNRLFYSIKLCDATDCVNKHVSKVEQIEKYIISCFDRQLSDNNLLPFVSPGPTYLAQATHIQYLDGNGMAHIKSKATEKQLTPHVINFRLLALSRWANLLGSLKPYEVGNKPLLIAYSNHLIK